MATKKTTKKATTKTAPAKKPATKTVKTKKCEYIPRTYKKGLIFVLIGVLGLVLIGAYFFHKSNL